MGRGGCGLTAAIATAQGGGEVLVLAELIEGAAATSLIADAGGAGLSGHSPGDYFSGSGILIALGCGMLAARAVPWPLP